jgi:aminopeptidase N
MGETAFWAGVALYLERHRFQAVHTRHFQRALEDASGLNLDRFFAEWVHGAGHPQVEVSVSHGEGQLSVAVKQTQDGDAVAKAFRFPLTLAFGGQTHRLLVDRRERTFTLPCVEAPAFVAVDSDLGVLADLTLKAPRSMLIAALRGDAGVIGRVRAARALAKDGHVQALAALREALVADPFWGVRAEIADLLAARGALEDVAALAGALGDAHPKARRRVVAALGTTRTPAAAEALRGMPDDASVQVEGEVARALARLRDPSARARCEALLGRESWGEVLRARAIEGLGMLRDADVLPALLRQAADDAHPRARAAACSALARLGDEVEATRTEVVERLVKLAEDPNYRVQVAAINALGALRDGRAMGVIGRVHASAGDGRARRLAFEAMANLREGRTTAEGLAGLRREVEGLVEENRKLRARVEKVEASA